MDQVALAQASFHTQFRAALDSAATSSASGAPALGTREGDDVPEAPVAASTSTQDQPYNAGYDTGRGWIAAGGAILALIIIVLLFAVVMTSRHHEHE